MKYISPLLKKFISLEDTPQNIAKNLILKTCEIEEIYERKISESIVIGYITACEKHPDADKLSVCQVHCGAQGSYQICCGGSNVAAGLYVPVALPGTVFEQAWITIQPKKMRWVESNGMICSKEELWILEDMEKHSIWSLTEDLDDISEADLGIPLREKFPRLENWVMEVDNKSLTNRPDLTGHFGAAIELNAIYSLVESQKSKVKNQSISFNNIKEYYQQCTPTPIMQTLKNATPSDKHIVAQSSWLNTYILLQLNDISIHTTSFFTRLHMLDIGSNSINNWVDFSNLFMNISGQPIHFFDADKVAGDIIVRNATDGELFVDLFGTQHILVASDIVIADTQKILALAGVVWGLESWITDTTKNILVEIANFDPVAVRKTWTRLWLRTDAELRYEKNINPRYSLFCLTLFLDNLTYFAKDVWSYTIAGLDYYINDSIMWESQKHITVDVAKMEQFIFGQKIKGFATNVENILHGLGFTFTDDQWILDIICPIWRGPDDLNIPEDIYEEVARIYGYDQIESLPLLSTTTYVPYTDTVNIQRALEDILVRSLGSNQIETYPRISEKMITTFGHDISHCYRLQNPVNPEAPYLRDNMIYHLIAHTAKNSKFFDNFTLFDIGHVWDKNHLPLQSIVPQFSSTFIGEYMQLWVVIYRKNIAQRDQDPLLEAKHIIHTITKELWLPALDFAPTHLSHFHPKKQSTLSLEGTPVGFVGTLHPLLLQHHKIWETSSVVYLSLDIQPLLDYLHNHHDHIYMFETLQDQIIWRDLCFVVDTSTDFARIIDAVAQVPEIHQVEVFDVYAGKNIWTDKKSISIKIKLIGDGTMTTEHINTIMNKAIEAANTVGGTLRE